MSSAVLQPCDETGRRTADRSAGTGTLVATVLASSLTFIEGSIVNVALPAMEAGLGTNAAGAQWIVNAYLLPLGALVLIGGALGDHYGRRRMLTAGVALFGLACLACAVAPSLGWLLAARAAQGAGAALIAPNSLAILATAFSGAARGRAVGTWAAAGAAGGALAPVIGGWITDALSWRWAFGIVVPLTVAALLAARRFMEESREEDDAAPLDWTGAALAAGALALAVWALVALPERGARDVAVWLALASGASLGAVFLVVEHRKGARAMTPLPLFATPAFAAISILTFLLYAALGGLLVLLPYVLIEAHGFSATQAGLALLPLPLVMGLLSRFTGGLAARVGPGRMLTAGPLVVAAGFAWLALVPDGDLSYARHLMPGLMAMAFGMAASVAPLTAAVMDAAPAEHVGVASGVNNAIARIAGLVAIALLGFVMGREGAEALMAGFRAAAWIGSAAATASALAILLLMGWGPPRGEDARGPGRAETGHRRTRRGATA